MKKINKNLIMVAVATLLAFGATGPIAAHAVTPPDLGLGAANGYAVFGKAGVTNSGAGSQTHLWGNVGADSSVIGLTSDQVGGTTITNGDTAGVATDASSAYDSMMSATQGTSTGLDLAGTHTIGSGVYDVAATTLNGTLTLNGPGVYIFRSSSSNTTSHSGTMILENGACASNVYWAVSASMTIGTNAQMAGTIIAQTGLISFGTGATLAGRAISLTGQVTLLSNQITQPTCSGPTPATLHVVKLVVGGTTPASAFTIHVKDSSSAEVDGGPFPGATGLGTAYSLPAGNYKVSEDASSSYVQSFSGSGCDASGNVTLSSGQDAICTVVNTAVAIPVVPTAVSPSGTKTVAGGGRIVPLIGVTKIPTPLALPAGSGPVTYNYTAWNVGGQQALDDVTVTDDTCSPVVYASGDVNGNGKIDPHENWKFSCTTTLSTTTTNTAIATGYSDDGFHQASIATAIATVVVGSSTPSPIINIVKVPSRLTPFPYGGGDVTYTYTVTNPGVVAMNNVNVADNKCGPVSYVAGDTNSNDLLDPGEAWTYTCETNVTASTMNTATAEGSANGYTAIGYAFATVLVAVPGLPNTGFPPRENNMPQEIALVVGILAVASISLIAIFKKQRTD